MRAGRPTDMSCELEVVIWPPLRLARMRCERGSVIVVLLPSSLYLVGLGEETMRIIRHGHPSGCSARDRHHEVRARILHQPFDLALVVALARPAKAIGKQVVAGQPCEGLVPLALNRSGIAGGPNS